jgi:hypothetical protein
MSGSRENFRSVAPEPSAKAEDGTISLPTMLVPYDPKNQKVADVLNEVLSRASVPQKLKFREVADSQGTGAAVEYLLSLVEEAKSVPAE